MGKSDIISIDKMEYHNWLQYLYDEIDRQRLKAVMQLNASTLQHYWWLGNDILKKQEAQGWGAKVIDMLSSDLQKRYGIDSGYSIRNLKYMRQFAVEYPDFPFVQVPLAQIQDNPVLKTRLAKITEFLLELGTGFAFVKRQFPLNIDGDESRVDLLMYHTRLHCYVAIELKAVEFQPEFLSKLNYYISAIDDLVKMPEDKPTIGLLLCRSKNAIKVEYALRGMMQPLGVASYKTKELMENLKSSLPSIDDLEKTLNE